MNMLYVMIVTIDAVVVVNISRYCLHLGAYPNPIYISLEAQAATPHATSMALRRRDSSQEVDSAFATASPGSSYLRLSACSGRPGK